MRKEKTVARPAKNKKRAASPREAITEPLRRASAAQKKEWAKTERELVRLRSGGAALFDELWETVPEVMSSDPPVYLRGGMRTAKDFIAKLLPGEDKRSVARKTLVAIAFSPQDEAEKGLGFLEEVVKLVQELSGSNEMPRSFDSIARLLAEGERLGAPLPAFVVDELSGYLDRGRLARFECDACGSFASIRSA